MKNLIKNSLLALGMSLAAAALISRWPEIQPRLAGTNWLILGVAAMGLLAYQFVNAGVWSLVLKSLGQPTPFAKTSKVWLQSEALRWLPGGIWSYGSRVVNAKELGVSKSKASTSLVLELALTNIAWMTAASLLLFTPLAAMAWQSAQSVFSTGIPWLLVSAGVALVATLVLFIAFNSPKARELTRKFLHLLPWRDLNPKLTLQTLLSYIGLCVFNGLLLWLVITAVPNLTVTPLLALGIGGGAWLAGFWAIGVPGGIGVREAALAAMLAAFGDLDSAIAVAVLWRALQMVVELISLLLVSLPVLNSEKGDQTCLEKATKHSSHFAKLRILNSL